MQLTYLYINQLVTYTIWVILSVLGGFSRLVN